MENLPPIPAPPVNPLVSKAYPVGARIIRYAKEILKIPVSEAFSDNCTLMDNLREQLRTSTDISLDRLGLFVDYVTLLTTLTSTLDMGPDGVGALYTWGSESLPLIEFDICCFSFNLTLALLKTASQYDLSSEVVLKPAFQTIQAALFLIAHTAKYHRVAFDKTITELTIVNVRNYCHLAFNMWQTAALIVGNKSKLNIARAYNLCSTLCTNIEPPLSGLARKFTGEAYINYAISLYDDKEVGRAISVLRSLISILPDQKVMKKFSATERQEATQLKSRADTLHQQYVDDNGLIFNFQPIPNPAEAVPSLPNKQQPGKLDWNPTVSPESLHGSLTSCIISKAEENFKNYTEQTEKAFHDIDADIALLPSEQQLHLQQLLTELYSKRSAMNEISNQIRGLLNTRNAELNRVFPGCFSEFQAYSNAISQARQTDQHYEVMFGKANSNMDHLLSYNPKLFELKKNINEKLEQARIISENAKKNASTKDPTSLISILREMNGSYDKLASELNPLFQELVEITKIIKAEADNNINNYRSELTIIETGFKQGIECYTNLVSRLNGLYNRINNAFHA